MKECIKPESCVVMLTVLLCARSAGGYSGHIVASFICLSS